MRQNAIAKYRIQIAYIRLMRRCAPQNELLRRFTVDCIFWHRAHPRLDKCHDAINYAIYIYICIKKWSCASNDDAVRIGSSDLAIQNASAPYFCDARDVL